MKLIHRLFVAAAVATTAGSGCAFTGPQARVEPPPLRSTNAGHDDALAETVLVQRLDDPVGREARVVTIEYPPGGSTAPHRHPGAILAYVLSGDVVVRLDGGEEVRYGPGQAWYERPGQLHAVSRNASATRPAELLVVVLTEPGEPQLHFERD
ncbi:MAG TPA: cupin domain-containing protein [Humisphaera sp.]